MVLKVHSGHDADALTAVDAVEAALSDADHTRLPSWLVARIAVDAATPSLETEFNDRVTGPLRDELEKLRSEVRRLSARDRIRLAR
jgi:hypothetical protein